MKRRRALIAITSTAVAPFAQAKLPLAQASDYRAGVDVSAYLVSEKLDGVRAYWDGAALFFRSGLAVAAPVWFTEKWPKTPLDGELWIARGAFDALSGTVRKAQPVDAEWRRVGFHVFDLPGAPGGFAERAQRMAQLAATAGIAHLHVVAQARVANEAALQAKLKSLVAAGGEGLMLHRADALHDAAHLLGRSPHLLKLKPVADAEATVIAHVAGKGKHTGRLGALTVRTPNGVVFNLGTGFTDAQRDNPPPIGAVVTYSYRDVTPSGKPRFAAFVRVRELP
jgi:DNA ligase 1